MQKKKNTNHFKINLVYKNSVKKKKKNDSSDSGPSCKHNEKNTNTSFLGVDIRMK